MAVIDTIALILGILVCLFFAPFITIGVIFILSKYLIFKIVGFIFLVLGIIHMISKII